MQRILLSIIAIILFCGGRAAAQGNNRLVFISDTQEPMWVETLKLKTENNNEATEKLFADLSQQQFAALFHLGDMVATEGDKRWMRSDDFFAAIKKNNIPVYATVGNHEYMFHKTDGIKKFVDRFGYQSTIGIVQTVDSVAVVLLNSNFGKLSNDERQRQMAWYTRSMDSLERSAGTKAIVVCTHYSPYTNSSIVDPSQEVIRNFVPKFLHTHKACLFLSGHSHNLEYFKSNNKPFVVIGGGGGLQQPLLTGEKQRYDDLLLPKNKLRFFYLIVTREKNQLILQVRGFASGNNLSDIETNEFLTIAI